MREVPRILGGPRTLYDGNVAANTKGGHTDIALTTPSIGTRPSPSVPSFVGYIGHFLSMRADWAPNGLALRKEVQPFVKENANPTIPARCHHVWIFKSLG